MIKVGEGIKVTVVGVRGERNEKARIYIAVKLKRRGGEYK